MLQRREGIALARPLYVDLDGTLIRSDMLAEGVFALAGQSPRKLLSLPLWLWRGKAALKREIASQAEIDAASLPYNADLVEWLKTEHGSGRRVVLATAADRISAMSVAAHLGCFDAVLASDGTTNLKADAKLAEIERDSGGAGFAYAGNSASDQSIFAEADEAIVVNPSRGVLNQAAQQSRVHRLFPASGNGARDWLTALRVHQWLKNLLVFVPLVLSHRIEEFASATQALLAFLAFSLCASSVYLLNDLVDMQADRRHPVKKYRPLAAGRIALLPAIALVPVLLCMAAAIATLLPPLFGAVLGVYFATTTAYTFVLKRTLLFDVLTLAGLYTLRIIAGAAAIAEMLSFWLIAFSIFLFFSLALLKRYVELEALGETGRKLITGRGYRREDRPMLSQFGATSALLAVLVLALYINSAEVQRLYRHPELIWLLCPALMYIVTRFWILAGRSEMHDDPIVFAVRDWRSQCILGFCALLLFAAAQL